LLRISAGPKGGPDPKYSLRPAAKKLEELLGKPIAFALVVSVRAPKARARPCATGKCSYWKTSASIPTKKKMTKLRRSSSRRSVTAFSFATAPSAPLTGAHASVVGITRFVRQAAAGLLMEKELSYLGKAMTIPRVPSSRFSRAKVSDKIEVIEN